MHANQTKRIFILIIVLLTASAGFIFVRNLKHGSGQRVQIGDSKSVVLSKLGNPVAVFTNDFASLKYGGEVWAYGREFDPKAVLRGDFPFKLRFFAPEDGDVLIVFDTTSEVKSLQVSKK
jgi:hypothetical protein